MATLISSANNHFLLQPHPVNMHDETIEWLSEMEFCKTELIFLTRLLNKSFLKAMTKKEISSVTLLGKRTHTFYQKTWKQLYDSIVVHEKHLASLDENSFSFDEKIII